VGEGYSRKLNLAKTLLYEIEPKRPGFKALLDQTGAANSAAVAARLADHAEMLLARTGD
jgi:hypothetical protein